MNETNPNHEPSNLADLHDRLLDRALAETIGGETPPDLTAQICSTSNVGISKPAASPRSSFRTIGLSALAVAASISIVGTTVFLFAGKDWRSAGRVSSVSDRGRVLGRPLQEPTSGVQSKAQYKPQLSNRARSKEAEWPEAEESLPMPSELGDAKASAPALVETSNANSNLNEESEFGLSTIQDQYATVDRPGIQVESDKLKDVAMGDWGFPRSMASPKPGLAPLTDGSGPTLSQSEDGPSSYERSWQSYLQAARSGLMKGGPSRGTIHDQGAIELETVQPTLDIAWRQSIFLGTGPGSPGDQYARIYENPFVKAAGGDAVSTFSIDVDTASYANVRQFLMDMRRLPPPDAVRIEELVNYFPYDYSPPTSPAPGSAGGSAGGSADDTSPPPFAAHAEVAGCPWAPEHRLVRIGIKGREIAREKRPPSNLVFLVDVSGSMDEPNKLPLVVDGLRQLTRELGENDRVAIVVYASSEGLALESTRGDKQQVILSALDRLRAGGSTAGGAGIQLAYQIAEDHFIPGGTNRVVLCTDGDFNVGVTSTAELERLVAQKAKDTKVFLSVLGFGRGNLNDAMMQTIADRGNGNHYYVDNRREARKVLVEEMTGTLVTIAKDVKIQVEFNPAHVAGYRLLGYENRMLRTQDFNDDTKDAGEIGAGHTVTALYEIVPAGKSLGVVAVDELKYQPKAVHEETDKIVHPTSDVSDELLTLKMRYKEPEGDVSRKLEWPISDADTAFGDATVDYRFAAAVAGFGLLLRDSQYKGDATYDAVAEIALNSVGSDPHGYRAELVELVRRAKELQVGR